MIITLRRLLLASALILSLSQSRPIGAQSGSGVFISVDRDITCIASSAGGTILAVTTGEVPFPNQRLRASDLWLFDARSRRKLHRLALGGWMQAAAFSGDGKLIAVVGEGVEVWQVAEGKRLFRNEQPASAKAVAFSPNGKSLAVVDADGELALLSGSTGKRLRGWRVSDDYAFAVAWLPDGREIITGGDYDGRLRFWDAATGRHIRTMRAHKETIDSIAFSPDGRRFATGSWDDTARIWETRSRKLLHALTGHSFNVWSAAFSHDGILLVTASGEMKVWDARTGRLLKTVPQDGMHAAFSGDGRAVLCESARDVKSWPLPPTSSMRNRKGRPAEPAKSVR